jgi:hypothetical protein
VLNEIGMLTSKVLTVTTSMSRTSVEAPRWETIYIHTQ